MAIPGSVRLGLLVAALFASAWSQGDIRKPPRVITPEREETRYIGENFQVTLQCQAEGIPTPTYKWTHNGEVVQSGNDVSYDSTSGKLNIPRFSKANQGIYICVAMNVFSTFQNPASSFGPPIELLQIDLPPFIPQNETTLTRDEYSYASLSCLGQVKFVGPDLTYKWYISQGTNEVPLNERMFIDNEGTLHFVYLLRTDATSPGSKYRCGISSPGSQVIRLGSLVNLEVNPENSPVVTPPRVQFSSSDVVAELSETALLECVVSGYRLQAPHQPNVTWYDDAGQIINSNSHPRMSIANFGRQLIIQRVEEMDERNYYCEGEIDSARSSRSQIYLNVTSKPIFIQQPVDQTVPEGRDVTFHCDARSASQETPPEAPVWMINGFNMGPHNAPNKYEPSNDRKQLTIKNVNKNTDIVCVQCEVRNSRGTIRGNGCLNVILPIKITNQPKLVQEIEKGDVINLTVTATSDPSVNLIYRWQLNNETYVPNPDFFHYDDVTKVAYVNTSGMTTDEYERTDGVYSRIIEHLYETKIVDIEVKLSDPVAGPLAASGGFDMWIIGLIIGIIFLIIVIIIIILVICRKKQEGDYNVDKKETGAGLDPEKDLKGKEFEDYSRPDYIDYDYPDKKPRGDLEYDDVPIGLDEESLGEEYGDEEDTHFNEDGSFIGIYDKKPPPPRPSQATESTI